MRDNVNFDARLADALGRLADLAPAMDDAAVARTAIVAGAKRRRVGWPGFLRGSWLDLVRAGQARRVTYLLIVLALLLAALVVALAGGALRNDPLRPLARNGSIVFTVQGNNHEAPVTHLMNADGTVDRGLDADRCPTFSRDGSVLASLSYEGSADLVVRDAAGTTAHRVLLVETPSTTVSFALSPDGTQVAWFKPAASGDNVELWVAPVAGGSATRILPASTVRDEFYASPLWSPGGDRIAFGTYVVDPGSGERRRTAISVVAADGSGLHRVTTRAGLLDDAMSWSPDDRSLAYVGAPDVPSLSPTPGGGAPLGSPPRDVFVIGADGSGDRNVTNTPAAEHRPDWSPDSAFLAFDTSADGDAHRLTTVRMNGPTPVGPLTPGPETEWFVWSPNGSELLWLEVGSIGPEAYRSTIHSIDPEFRQSPKTLHAVDGLVDCAPSWQRLEP